jgi:hypothetical protein
MENNLSTEEIVKIAAKEASKATMERLEKERQKEKATRYDRRLHNTKLLLRNYRMLAAYVEEAVYTQTPEDENAIDILDCMCAEAWKTEDVEIESIKRSVARTHILMEHVTSMLELYHTICELSPRPEDGRRWRVISGAYIEDPEKTFAELAKDENCDTRTIQRDMKFATEKLSALFFGLDGLETRNDHQR